MLGMRGGAVITLMGLTALVAYSLGRQGAPTGKQTAAIVLSTAPAIEKPVALETAPLDAPAVPSPQPSTPPPTANSSSGRRGASGGAVAAWIMSHFRIATDQRATKRQRLRYANEST